MIYLITVHPVQKLIGACDIRMNNIYDIDFTSDIVRGKNNLGTSKLFKNLSLTEVNNMIDEYTKNFGMPRFLAGMILWIDKNNDTYCLSVYKNEKCFSITCLDDLKQSD